MREKNRHLKLLLYGNMKVSTIKKIIHLHVLINLNIAQKEQ